MKPRQSAALLPACTLAVGALLAFGLESCREDNSAPKSGPSPDSVHLTADTLSGRPLDADPDSLLAAVLPLQDSVYRNPQQSELTGVLVQTALDSASGSFVVVGKGVVNPEMTDEAARAGRQRAAQSDAKRWSLYLKAWYGGDTRAFGDAIEGKVAYTQVLLERMQGDTLLQLVQVPLGSVEVE
ncbi:MAG: hypothetical protein GF331_25835 [Chitinivibrionales bacterium]|nr:hypothetical protein [Chitinivibrionales bacterium]